MNKKYKLLRVLSFCSCLDYPGVQYHVNEVIKSTLAPSYKYSEENNKLYNTLKKEERESEYIKLMRYDKYPVGENYAANAIYPGIKLVSECFEVDTLLNSDIGGQVDLKIAIETYKPDLIYYMPLMELQSSENVKQLLPLNPDAYPEIPRVIHAGYDKISPLLSAGIMLGEELGVEANFSSSVVDGEFDWLPFPSYYYPQSMSVSNKVFKDYNEKKEFTIGMFGAGYFENNFYPWRRKISEKVCGKFPIVHFPQPNNTYRLKMDIPKVYAHDYSRMINRCQFGITCGSITNTVLAKHFEIPASRTCLLTEDSHFLRAHGFIDRENCVCVTPENVLDKIGYYLSHPDELRRITDNGYEFVQSTCMVEKIRNNLLTWFELRRNLKPGEKIVQTGIFDFKIVSADVAIIKYLNRDEDMIVHSYNEGFKFLQQGDIQAAYKCFTETLGYVEYEPHGRLGMALVNLFSKNAKLCLAFLEANFAHEQNQGGLGDFHDPVEIAYYIIAEICMRDVQKAFAVSRMWLNHTHVALKAARIIAAAAVNQNYDSVTEEAALAVHSRCPVVISSVEGWINHFQDVLKIHGIIAKG